MSIYVDVQHYKKPDKLMRGRRNRKAFELAVGDVGNATCTLLSSEGYVTFPHAIRALHRSELDALEERNPSESIYWVNGQPYQIGQAATKVGDFGLRFGTDRYVPNYIGVLYAIALFHAYEKPPIQLYVLANHPPIHYIYRPEIIASITGKFIVEHMGVKKTISVTEVGCYHEPTGGWIHALLNDAANRVQGTHLQKGQFLVVDVGGFTTDFSGSNQGTVDTLPDNCKSIQFGMLEILKKFELLVRKKNRKTFIKIQTSPQAAWREAFAEGLYQAKAHGEIVCSEEATVIGMESVQQIFTAIESEMDGLGVWDGILLSGGGGSFRALGRFFEMYLDYHDYDLQLFYADENQNEMHLATARGGRKQAIYAMSQDRLWET